jgi:hypothetical protein
VETESDVKKHEVPSARGKCSKRKSDMNKDEVPLRRGHRSSSAARALGTLHVFTNFPQNP